MKRWGWMPWAVLVLRAASALGQATSVQLPTYSYFGVGTTVMVPDGGSAYLGGVNRARSSRIEGGVPGLPFAPFQNRAIGSERSASNMSVSVTIHDFAAMDAYLLGQTAGGNPVAASGMAPIAGQRSAANQLTPRPSEAWQPRPAESPAPSVAQIQAEGRQQQQTREDEGGDFYRRGQAAEAAGKAGVAKIYYQMAARRAVGPLKDEILARLDAVEGRKPAAALAQGPQ
jgi:hypothetical protein